MNKSQLENLVNKKLSTRQIASELSISQTNVRYWMTKYNLKSKYYKKVNNPTQSYCSICEEIKDVSEFALRKTRGNKPCAYCKSCDKQKKAMKVRLFKQDCLDYKGTNSCERCGYDKNIIALDFHHVNPEEKDFTISHQKKQLTPLLKQELDKCIVLCANCHREEHDTLNLD